MKEYFDMENDGGGVCISVCVCVRARAYECVYNLMT